MFCPNLVTIFHILTLTQRLPNIYYITIVETMPSALTKMAGK